MSLTSNSTYLPPELLDYWVNDIRGGNRYEVMIFGDGKVVSTGGSSVYDFGSLSCTWEEFMDNSLHELIATTMGEAILKEVEQRVAHYVSQRTRDVF